MQEAVRVRRKRKTRKKKRKNPAPPKAHHETHISPATETTSKRRTKYHVPRVSPCSPVSIHTGFVEIGLAQLSQSVKTTNSMSHMRTHAHTDIQQTVMAPCTHPGRKRPLCLKAKTTSVPSLRTGCHYLICLCMCV